jgi:hypothetical protein
MNEPLREVVVWNDDEGWVRIGGPGTIAEVTPIWRAERERILRIGVRRPQVWMRTVQEGDRR